MRYFKVSWLPYALNFKDNSIGIIVFKLKKKLINLKKNQQYYNSITQRIMFKHILIKIFISRSIIQVKFRYIYQVYQRFKTRYIVSLKAFTVILSILMMYKVLNLGWHFLQYICNILTNCQFD